MIIEGIGPDAPTTSNSAGGQQSLNPYGFHLIPARALFEVARVLQQGAAKYGETLDDRNYNKVPLEAHLNHALAHIFAMLAGDSSDAHGAHACCRLLFALDQSIRYENGTEMQPHSDS
ncbi:hypothetical protein FACS1894184_17980 [Clostridia bacterium]|nr:hypothetical protein FACS1894184_17980 [Clostridia bacterium]